VIYKKQKNILVKEYKTALKFIRAIL